MTNEPCLTVAVERAVFDFLCRKYVQRADDRQREMGLTYTVAETHDLAKELTRFLAAQGMPLREDPKGLRPKAGSPVAKPCAPKAPA